MKPGTEFICKNTMHKFEVSSSLDTIGMFYVLQKKQKSQRNPAFLKKNKKKLAYSFFVCYNEKNNP